MMVASVSNGVARRCAVLFSYCLHIPNEQAFFL